VARSRPVAVRLAGFALVLAVAFVAAFGVGRAVGPLDDGRDPTGTDQHQDPTDHDGGHP
jgi:hypothetical protein